MNLRQRFTLDPALQRVHNEISERGDRLVVFGALVIGVLLLLGVIA